MSSLVPDIHGLVHSTQKDVDETGRAGNNGITRVLNVAVMRVSDMYTADGQ